jgi:hypothetical protein
LANQAIVSTQTIESRSSQCDFVDRSESGYKEQLFFSLQNMHCTMGDSECTYHWNQKPIDPPFEALLGFQSELSIALGSQQEARSLVSVRWNIEFPIDSGIVVISRLDVGHRDLFVVHGLRHISIDATMTRTTINREEKEKS